MPQFEWIEEITARLDSGLGITHIAEKIIQFDENPFLKGLEHITLLYNSIIYNKTLEIKYQSFKQDNPQDFTIHPYFLKQYNNRWFLFGMNENALTITNLALDRIIEIQESRITYKTNTLIDFNEYFEDFIGVSLGNDGQLEKVTLRVNNQLLPYIKTKPIHGSQRVTEQGEHNALIILDIIPNYELESMLLSFGEGVEIVSPDTLRLRVKSRIQLSLSKYE
jgi:predicted DNA-binding transcriptional regulator YafY